MSEPTARPWWATGYVVYGPWVGDISGNGKILAELDHAIGIGCSHGEAKANAAHIVKCVNNHEPLLEAAKAAKARLNYHLTENLGRCSTYAAEAMHSLIAAIRAVEGGGHE